MHFNYGNLYVEGCQKMAMQTSVFFYFSVNLTSFACLSCPVLLVLSCLSCLPCSAALSCLSCLPCWACSILPDGAYALFFLSCLPYPVPTILSVRSNPVCPVCLILPLVFAPLCLSYPIFPILSDCVFRPGGHVDPADYAVPSVFRPGGHVDPAD